MVKSLVFRHAGVLDRILRHQTHIGIHVQILVLPAFCSELTRQGSWGRTVAQVYHNRHAQEGVDEWHLPGQCKLVLGVFLMSKHQGTVGG